MKLDQSRRFSHSANVAKWRASTNVADAWKFEMSQHMLRLFLTITFKPGTSDHKANKLLNAYLDKLNWLILKHRYRRGEEYLRGLCVRERQTDHVEQTLHYHISFFDDGCHFRFAEQRDKFDNKANKAEHCINKLEKRKIIDSVHIQNSYRTDPDIDDGRHTAYSYPVKNYKKVWNSDDEASDAMALLHKDGVTFGDNQLKRF